MPPKPHHSTTFPSSFGLRIGYDDISLRQIVTGPARIDQRAARGEATPVYGRSGGADLSCTAGTGGYNSCAPEMLWGRFPLRLPTAGLSQ
jgi:hypothetical protein